ncbi:CDP-diacylglycerol--glycerol-3-phosphate 3-phosphatidyltransferase [Thermodesulforhabdus norvegica]|uniref:CDP-diacylglycerol--glycerol-3-phosphate 3-phosphatidyltransferase n=1 Tax=Thermodesulforhabdus norvegica TaxID=39841 RepID=A0A1I4W5F1_9BACT|nr:CDP-diacylglycerol--glycerol-3-phosphate 3-phosphatidyltransferase [Thermodesulforhabdus norvegica]SFN08470.1 CDP-diacylglycerol--glycerol-3-phosphate 3-phosphatidyltransferase [Thermodesulforhabdus norvegica]
MTRQNERKAEFLNLPNILTCLRICAIPLVILLLIPPVSPVAYNCAFLLCLFALITDYLDGILARRHNRVTSTGKLLDPLADKLLVSAVFIMLIPLGRIPAWMTFMVVSREIIITGLRSLAASHGLIINASRLGKNKMVSQSIAMLLLLLSIPGVEEKLVILGQIFVGISIILGYWSAVRYFMNFYRETRR